MAAAKKLALGRASYSDLTLEDLKEMFGIVLDDADLFSMIKPLPIDAALVSLIARHQRFPLLTEKARSEFLVSPVLGLACEWVDFRATIYSGLRFDVLPEKGLRGVCDFILSKTPSRPILEAPILMTVEAKKHDLDLALGQCAAEMIAAQIFNERAQNTLPAIYGCVTTGEQWRFLRLTERVLCLDRTTYHLTQISHIISILRDILN
jgi:hypothetical protein